MLAIVLENALDANRLHRLAVVAALAFQIDLLERRLRLKALRAQRLESYKLSRHHQIGDDC